MAQELDPQPVPLMRTLDEPGDISHHKRPFFAIVHHSQMRSESRKREVCYPRSGGRDGSKQGRFSRVGETDQADIGQEAQFKLQDAFFSRQTRLGESRGSVRRGGKEGVALSPLPSPSDDDLLSPNVEIG